MLHKLKPVPRALMIIVIVGGIGFGLTKVDFSKFSKKDAPVEAAAEAPIKVAAPATSQVAAPEAVQDAPVGLLRPATNDAGLDAVLRAGKK